MQNFSITFGCHELLESDKVHHEGIEKPWITFKECYPKWNFEVNDKNEISVHKDRNIKIWNLIGPCICKYYQKIDKINIKFINADVNAKRMGSI